MSDFKFDIKSIDCGWLIGKVTLCGSALEFYMSAVVGDDLKHLLLAALSVCEQCDEVSEMINYGDYYCEDFPCDTVQIDEEGTIVEWNILQDKARDLVRITISAERYDKDGNATPVCLQGAIARKEFITEIVAGIDEWLHSHGLTQYFRRWGAPFPLTEFLTAKAVVSGMPLPGNLDDDIALLSAVIKKSK